MDYIKETNYLYKKTMEITKYHDRITQRKKEANDFEWYRNKIDGFDAGSFMDFAGFDGVSLQRRMMTNYDLYNNIIDTEEFKHVCKPYGEGLGEMPATFTNRDITSGKIKVLLGMESKKPFGWKVIAVNEEATTRKEQEYFGRLKEYVIGEIMQPIVAQIQQKAAEQSKGRKLSDDEAAQIQQQVAQEIKGATPEEIKKYMERDHQDPAEALMSQLLEYLIEKLTIKDVFNDGWKHALLSGLEVFYVGEAFKQPDFHAVNSLNFDYDKSPDLKFIEDGEWACATYDMSPSKILEFFGDELTDDELDKIYEWGVKGGADAYADPTFTFSEDRKTMANTVRVFHANFKSLRKIGYLYYISPQTGKQEMTIVSEDYKINKDNGDLGIKWTYIPESHEGYKIGYMSDAIYKRMRPVPGQHKDINNLYECKLSYKGAAYDNMNSQITSLMDRMKPWQFYFDIIMYRIEMLMASDKGKILMMNLNMIPKSKGIDLKKMLYYMESSKIGFLNPNEEGNRGGQGDIVNAAKEIDMSLVSDIQKYIQLADYIELRCGASVGITKPMEGQTAPNESVGNNQLNYTQSSYILEPYFELHNQIKRNVLQSIVDTSKNIYVEENIDKLIYVIDDLSTRMLEIDSELLDSSTYGFFIANSSKAWDAKQAVQQLSQAAMQNQKAELSDVIKVIRSESVQEAEELLEVAEKNAEERQQAAQDAKAQQDAAAAEKQRQFLREQWKHDEDIIVIKEEERRKTEIQKQVIMSMGFNVDKDMDKDGEPDILEVAKHGLDAQIKLRQQALEENKFNHQLKQDEVTNKQTDEELKIKAKAALKKPKT